MTLLEAVAGEGYPREGSRSSCFSTPEDCVCLGGGVSSRISTHEEDKSIFREEAVAILALKCKITRREAPTKRRLQSTPRREFIAAVTWKRSFVACSYDSRRGRSIRPARCTCAARAGVLSDPIKPRKIRRVRIISLSDVTITSPMRFSGPNSDPLSKPFVFYPDMVASAKRKTIVFCNHENIYPEEHPSIPSPVVHKWSFAARKVRSQKPNTSKYPKVSVHGTVEIYWEIK
ncbi:hypothetical protein ACLOJK_006065 [Asimina triloba]